MDIPDERQGRWQPLLIAAVVTLLAAGTAWSALPGGQAVVFTHDDQDHDEWRELVEPLQRLRMHPTIDLRSDFWGSRSLARRVLDHGEELELTREQEEQIRDAMRAFRRDEIRRDADIEVAELELDELMEDADADLTAVEARMRELADLRVDARMAELRHERAVEAVLTAEQLDELEELGPFPALLRAFELRHDDRWR